MFFHKRNEFRILADLLLPITMSFLSFVIVIFVETIRLGYEILENVYLIGPPGNYRSWLHLFITSLCGVKGESGFCQRLSVCMPLLHCMAKRKFIHISRH